MVLNKNWKVNLERRNSMKSKKRAMALFLSFTMILTSLGFSGNQAVYAEVSAGDFNVNTSWTMSGDITTKYTVKSSKNAYSTGKAKIGDIGVTATFVNKLIEMMEHPTYLLTEITKQPMEQQMICFMVIQIQQKFLP